MDFAEKVRSGFAFLYIYTIANNLSIKLIIYEYMDFI